MLEAGCHAYLAFDTTLSSPSLLQYPNSCPEQPVLAIGTSRTTEASLKRGTNGAFVPIRLKTTIFQPIISHAFAAWCAGLSFRQRAASEEKVSSWLLHVGVVQALGNHYCYASLMANVRRGVKGFAETLRFLFTSLSHGLASRLLSSVEIEGERQELVELGEVFCIEF